MMDSDNSPFNQHTASVALDSVRITLDLYRSGKSGIPYGLLQQFTRPILAHYQLELEPCFEQEVSVGNVEDMTLLLDIFEIASTFWDYCSLSEQQKQSAFSGLKSNLLGPTPDREEALQFPILLAALENTWEHLAPSMPARSEMNTLDAAVPQELAILDTATNNGFEHYGPDQLELPEAFALFSRPILENDAIFENPDYLEEAMVRAQAYWDVCHVTKSQLESELKGICSNFASASEPASSIREEAHRMIQRFYELFPERK